MIAFISRNNPRLGGAFLCCAALSIFAPIAHADFKTDTGYNALVGELGAATPNGTGVKVTIVEANTDTNVDGDGVPIDGTYNFKPDPSDSQFVGPAKTFTVRIPPPTVTAGNSAHATFIVGRPFFGKTISVAGSISEIESFEANHWLGSGELGTLTGVVPLANAHLSRVSNHSYVGAIADSDVELELLERVDWLVARDEFLVVVGRGIPQNPLLHSAFNAIGVGETSGDDSATVSFGQGGIYVGGRPSVELVSSSSSASGATAEVSSVAALLVQQANDNPLLSNGSVTNRNAQTICHGETAEAIKAILMAGADRQFITDAPNGDTYTVNTAHGVDVRYGAGMVNAYNSYYILDGGEQDSAADGGGTIGAYGFDYDPSFGGAGGSNALATYRFTTGAINEIAVTLAWHALIDIDEVIAENFVTAATLHNLDLTLIRETGGDVVVATSTSMYENYENIWLTGLAGGTYRIEVSTPDAPFEFDYAIAWRIDANAVPTPTSGAALAVMFVAVAARRRQR